MPTDTSPLDRVFSAVAAVAAALRFLTRLPVPRCGPADDPAAPPRLADVAWAFPVAGALIGIAGALAAIALDAALPPVVAATIAVAVMLAITGALHEDGFADSLDALGGRSRERRLEIMRDSRIGTFGAAGLALVLVLRVSVLAALLEDHPAVAFAALVAAGAFGRAAAVWMLTLPPARPDGLGAAAGAIAPPTLAASVAVAAAGGIPVMVLVGIASATVVVTVAGAVVAAVAVRALARRLLGGQTGDAAGAAAVTTELAVLVVAATVAGPAA